MLLVVVEPADGGTRPPDPEFVFHAGRGAGYGRRHGRGAALEGPEIHVAAINRAGVGLAGIYRPRRASRSAGAMAPGTVSSLNE